MTTSKVKDLLDYYLEQYNCPSFIESDPISIPHRFTDRRDIEIAGFFAATFSWGQRKTIINKCSELMSLMDNQPYAFVKHHQARERKTFEKFVHRTFQYTDTIYFLTLLQHHYNRSNSLEDLFLSDSGQGVDLARFHNEFFDLPYAPDRTRKHVPTPLRNSTCKRINMYLRWMVRDDGKGVDFGLWKRISPRDLLIPLDVHVDRIARRLNLLTRKQTDWLATIELTSNLRIFDANDPVKYDFALFGMGVMRPDFE
ncbi:MAG: TIGR02757 family protein [Saprospiraceae bacterium]|nr:TIGR02757 family protein [Saprospiraceae bacterium]